MTELERKVRRILAICAREYDVETILTKHRGVKTVEARWCAMWLLRRLSLSLQTIAIILMRKDHTTVAHGLKIVEKRRKTDLNFRLMLTRLAEEVDEA